MSIKIPFWATFLTILGVAVLCGLGTWQIQRLEWKTELLATLNAEFQKDARQYPVTAQELSGANLQNKRGYVEGYFHQEQQYLLRPRTHEGTPGYHLYIPFETTDGVSLLVNRGYVPLDWPSYMKPPSEKRTVAGMFRHPDQPNIFTPANEPAQNAWYWVDVNAMGEGMAPYVLYEEREYIEGTYPIPSQPGRHINNNHLQYAVFWFFMAGALMVVYAIRFLRKPED